MPATAAAKVASAAAKSVKATAKRAKAASEAAATKTHPFDSVLPISPLLRKFYGVDKISRPESMKRFWSYVKENALQNPEKKREIVCDEKLKLVLGKDTVDFLEVPRLLNLHFPKKMMDQLPHDVPK